MVLRNILANYIGTGLVGVINIVSLSLFVKYFGMENWGEISTYIAIVSFLMMLDLGISQVYIAKFHAAKDGSALFAQFRFTLLVLGILGATLVWVGFHLMEFFSYSMPTVYHRHQLLFMALVLFLVNLMNNFYYTHLIALEKQLQQNIRWVFFVFLKNLGVLIFLAISLDKTAEVYFGVMLLVASIALLVNVNTIFPGKSIFCTFSEIVLVMKDSRFLSLGVGVGMVVFYLDRLQLPLLVDIKAFGIYSTVLTIALYFLQLQYPISKAFFPYIARKIHLEGDVGNTGLLWQTLILGGLLLPILLLVGFFAQILLSFYSIPAEFIQPAKLLLRSVLFAVFINAIYHSIYIRLIVDNRNKAILSINVITLIFSFIVIWMIGKDNPFLAGAISWAAVSVIQLAGGIVYIIGKNKIE